VHNLPFIPGLILKHFKAKKIEGKGFTHWLKKILCKELILMGLGLIIRIKHCQECV
jgi:hypothetical protein